MNQILLAATTAAHEAGNIIHSFFHSEYKETAEVGFFLQISINQPEC
jgi:hypothetical protein